MSGAVVKKKRKAAGSPAAAAGLALASKKLAGGIGSLMARLEATNASFLQSAANAAVQSQLARVKAAPAASAPLVTASPSLSSLPIDGQELSRRAERQARFREEAAAAAAAAGIREPAKTLVELRSEQGVARGQNLNPEKEYFRLTSLPSAADVRPPEVLRQALELVKQRWTQGCDYKEACSQLKSIRQDLTVQHIRSRLTVQVYETHGRIAIEVGDHAEYRQCHSVLQTLYAEGLQGEQCEFTAYGLLYAAAAGREVLVHELAEAFGSRGGGGGGAASLAGDRQVSHALEACRAYQAGNFVRFLRLYDGAPRMAPYLMDVLLAKLRGRAYGTMLAAFQPSVPLSALAGWFGFSKRKEAAAFLRERGAAVVDGCLDVRASRAAHQQRQQQQQQEAGQ